MDISGCFIVTKRVDALFRSGNLSTWDSVPVSVAGKPDSSWFAPVLQGPSISQDEAGLVKNDKGIVMRMDGLRFHVDMWDGRDFFRVGNYCGVIVTPRVVSLLEQEGVKGWDAKSVLDIKF